MVPLLSRAALTLVCILSLCFPKPYFNQNDGSVCRTGLRFDIYNSWRSQSLTNGAVVPLPSRAALTPVCILTLCFPQSDFNQNVGDEFDAFHFWRHKRSLPMVQWSPSHPGLHSHLPSLQWPCSAQWEWHVLSSQVGPTQPSSHWQIPLEHTPWLPQSRVHSSAWKTQTHRVGQHCTLQTDCTNTNSLLSGIPHQLDQTWDFIAQHGPSAICLPPSLAVTCQIIYFFGVGLQKMALQRVQ